MLGGTRFLLTVFGWLVIRRQLWKLLLFCRCLAVVKTLALYRILIHLYLIIERKESL